MEKEKCKYHETKSIVSIVLFLYSLYVSIELKNIGYFSLYQYYSRQV